MKKRLFSLLLVLLLVFLCGCSEVTEEPTESQQVGVLPTASSTEQSAQGTSAGQQTQWEPREVPEVEDVALQIPPYEGEPLLPYDPDRKVYIPFCNQDVDFYPNYYYRGITGFVITKERFEIEDIQVNIPVNTEYEIIFYDFKDTIDKLAQGQDIGSPATLETYQYLTQQGIDWQAYSQLFANYNAAGTIISDYLVEMQYVEGLLEKYQAYQTLYLEQKKAYETECEKIEQGQVPFSIYEVTILFTGVGAYEETAESIEVIIGGESYTVDIGQWRFHTELPAELQANVTRTGISQKKIMIGALQNTPYTGGVVQLQDALSFTALKDLTITGVHQVGVQIEMLGGRVQITGDTDADFYWDLQQPLDISEGDMVNITLFLRDERFAQYEVGISTCIVMDYEINSKTYGMNLPCLFARINNRGWDTYLMAFEGYDMGEYYTCYYVPWFERWWLNDLPEGWLE